MGVLWEPLLAFSQYASHSRAIGINANTPVLAQLLAFSQYAVPAIAFLFTCQCNMQKRVLIHITNIIYYLLITGNVAIPALISSSVGIRSIMVPSLYC